MTTPLRHDHPPHTWRDHTIQPGDTVKARNRHGLAVTITVRTWSSPEAREPFVTGPNAQGNIRSVRLTDVVRIERDGHRIRSQPSKPEPTRPDPSLTERTS